MSNVKREFETELEEILGQDPAELIRRQEKRFADAVGTLGKSFVLFGAGRLGRIALTGLLRAGIPPRAFADNSPALWDTTVDALPVLAPRVAAERFGSSAVFVVTVFTGAPVLKQLREMGLRVITFAELAWHYADALIPHGALDQPDCIFEQAGEVRNALGVWADDASRQEYIAQLQWRTSLDADLLPPHLPGQSIYFPDELAGFTTDETLVDCGAFDGDSIREFVQRPGIGFREIVAIEPDPENRRRLESYAATLPRGTRAKIRIVASAAGTERGRVMFDPTGTPHSTVGRGALEVESVPLDEILADSVPTYIKLDIEGAEPDALLGARAVIRQHRPILAVCLYHQPKHLWQLPLLLRTLTIRSRLFLRRYSDDCWELVAYVLPVERIRT